MASYVYFIQQGDDGPVKVGFARDVASRLIHLQHGNPQPLYLRAFREGTRADERALHDRLWADRIRGEWFALSAVALAELRAAEEAMPEFECSECEREVRYAEYGYRISESRTTYPHKCAPVTPMPESAAEPQGCP